VKPATRGHFWHFAAIVCLLAAAAPAAAQETLFAGNEHAVWLVRRAADGNGVDVLARPAGEKWKLMEAGFQGRPTGAATLGGSLRALFGSGAHVAFHLNGQRSPEDDANWPDGAQPVAMCEATDFAAPNTPSILAVVAGRAAAQSPRPRTGPAAPTAPTRPAIAPAGAAPARRDKRLLTTAVFQFAEGEWSQLPPPGMLIERGRRVFAAAVDSEFYLLLPDHETGWNKLIVLGNGKWRDVDLDDKAARSHVLAMLPLDDRLAILLSKPKAGASRTSAIIAIRDANEDTFSYQPITQNGVVFEWPHSSLPRAARFAGHLALLWRDAGKTRLATCDRTGQIISVDDVVVDEPPEGNGLKALEIFLWIVLLGTFLPMILLRPKSPPRPFSLPPTHRPASPGKRLLAALIDLFICSTAGGAMFMPRDISPEQAKEILRKISEYPELAPDSFAYAALASLAIFVVYGFVMELRYGATLGKLLLKMRVVGEGGQKADLREVSLRNLWKIIEIFLPPRLPLLPLVILFNRNRQRVGDWLARTAVVDARLIAPPPQMPDESAEPDEPDQPSHPDDTGGDSSDNAA